MGSLFIRRLAKNTLETCLAGFDKSTQGYPTFRASKQLNSEMARRVATDNVKPDTVRKHDGA